MADPNDRRYCQFCILKEYCADHIYPESVSCFYFLIATLRGFKMGAEMAIESLKDEINKIKEVIE